MRALIQRVRRANVTIEGKVHGEINQGLVVLLGVGQTDTEKNAVDMAKKIANLRIFEDAQGKMNLSIQDIGGAALVISQFTLYADTSRGNRPSFIYAGLPAVAEPLVNRFIELLGDYNIPTATGVFGAEMLVSLENDGPVTIWLEL